jgi:hypothetical protein
MMAALIARYLQLTDGERTELDRYIRPVLRNWNGIAVGDLRPAPLLLSSRPSAWRESRDPGPPATS